MTMRLGLLAPVHGARAFQDPAEPFDASRMHNKNLVGTFLRTDAIVPAVIMCASIGVAADTVKLGGPYATDLEGHGHNATTLALQNPGSTKTAAIGAMTSLGIPLPSKVSFGIDPDRPAVASSVQLR